MDDALKNIIIGCCNNERVAQEKLYKQFFPNMMKMCMRYTNNREDAMLIVNDGFLRVFKKIEKFEYKGSIEGWIRRIVYHSISDYFKKDSRRLKFLELDKNDRKTESSVLHQLYELDIIKLIKEIPKASADVFVLYAIEGFSHAEIADKKGISVGTSKWHLSEARKKLQKLILKQESRQQYVFG